MSMIILAALTSLCPVEAEALEKAAAAFEARYVLQDRAGTIATTIREEAGALPVSDGCMAPENFAEEATAYLRGVSGDKHVMVEAGDQTPHAPDSTWVEHWYADAPEVNYGVRAVEILDGNIGYLRLTTFYDLPEAWSRFAAAFTLLQDTDAMVLDLRRNGGGAPAAELRIQWSFLAEGSHAPLVMDRAGSWEARDVPPIDWPRYLGDRPVAILIDRRTFSAAEAATYGLQALGRVFVVGELSGGGAHMVGEPIELAGNYLIRMPDERPLSPVTGENWEGRGVEPDIPSPPDEALDVALSEIRRRLGREKP